jgi:Bacteriocin-protection, YdeI or OmpD-Associated
MTSERQVSFTATPAARARGGIAIELPFDPSARWGDKDVHHVTGTVSGCTVRGALTHRDDAHYLELGPAWCRDAPFPLDAPLQVTLDPEGPQYETLAADFAAALGAEPAARHFFESLATFYRTGYVRWIEDAKRPDTRARRIAETVDALRAGKKQLDDPAAR